jgi:hypothetical protein
VAVLAILAKKLLAMDFLNVWISWSYIGISAVSIAFLWVFKYPRRKQVSLLVDERLKLRERFSTTLALSGSDNPFAQAACREARERAKLIRIDEHFPVKASKKWAYAFGIWLAVGAMFLYLPQKDLLGFLKKQQDQQAKSFELEKAKTEIQSNTLAVKSVVEKLSNADLDSKLAKLSEIPPELKPNKIKLETIKQLGNVADQIKQMQSGVKQESMKYLQQMLKQLRGSPDSLSRKLRQALSKGDFAQASNLLKQMQKELVDGKLSDEQKKALAEQLKNLAGELEKLARMNKELEDELEKLGLDKKLAGMSEKELRQALQKKGLSQDQIEELLKKASACKMANSRCSGLGKAMASCGAGLGGLGSDELAALVDQLDDLESLQQQMMLMQASLDEIGRACQGLGEGMCRGMGCQAAFMEGNSKKYGPGAGGLGRGFGPRASDDAGDTSTKAGRVKNKAGQGPVVASWYFKDTQIKGDAKRGFTEVIQAGRDTAAEAINENQIPRKYEDAVKQYFGQLEDQNR